MGEEKPKINVLQTLDAYLRCLDDVDKGDWVTRHEEAIYHYLVDEVLPHGSGIDCDWEIWLTKKGVSCHNSYHRMDDAGGYCGWIPFKVFIKAEFRDMFGRVIWKVSGKFGRHQDIKEYLEELLGHCLDRL